MGRSALFNQLTKRYVSVSNYPGTTVSISRGLLNIHDTVYEVIDTPGLYSLLPITDDERVARRVMFEYAEDIVVHVADAKNIDRTLSLTLQLLEMGSKILLVLNIMDEADREGIKIDTAILEKQLGIPVVKTVSIQGRGIPQLKEKIYEHANGRIFRA